MDDLFVLRLIDRSIEEFVLKRNVLHFLDAIDPVCVERGHWLNFSHNHQIWLLVDYQNPHHKVNFLSNGLLLTDLLSESLLAHQTHLRGKSVDPYKRGSEGGLPRFELDNGIRT